MTENIEIHGKLYPLNFGVACRAEVSEAIGLAMRSKNGKMQMGEITLSETSLLKILYYGLYHGHRVTGKPWDKDYYDMCDWIEGETEVLIKAVDIYSKWGGEGNAKAPKKGATKSA